jgi:hypothetical protein
MAHAILSSETHRSPTPELGFRDDSLRMWKQFLSPIRLTALMTIRASTVEQCDEFRRPISPRPVRLFPDDTSGDAHYALEIEYGIRFLAHSLDDG